MEDMNKIGGKKKGQVTIFIIIAVVIVLIGLLLFLFYPRIQAYFSGTEINPNIFIEGCIEEDLENSIEILSSQGGSIKPEHYILYNSEKIEYLCYTEEYYKTCVMQQPMLKKHIESEIHSQINGKVGECVEELKDMYESRGYDVTLNQGDTDVELTPKKIVITVNSIMSVTKDGSQRYEKFVVLSDNNLYELVGVANSILNWEATYGDSETTTYMNYYHDLKVEKKKQSEGSTIYILTDRPSGNKFQFASRSIAWPPAYGIDGVRF